MPTKKKAFPKKNTVKYLVLPGHETAVNADGENLHHEWVEVQANRKPGSSLLAERLIELSGRPVPRVPHNGPNFSLQPSNDPEADLEAILDQFDDASCSGDEDIFNDMKKLELADGLEKLNQGDFIIEEEYEENEDDYQYGADDFSNEDSDLSEPSSPVKQNNCSEMFEILKKRMMDEKYEEYDHGAFFSSLERKSPENMTMFEEKMEKKLEEYEEDQIGPLDDEEICGYLTGENKHIEYFIGKKKDRFEDLEVGKCEDSLKEKILKYSEEEHISKLIEIVTEHPVEFDCESFISTYSNKYNHPSVIREEGKIRKIKIPNNPLQKQLTKSKLKQLDSESESEDGSDDDVSVASTINIRPKGETPEQRLERKKFFKQVKSENRKLKKENKIAFKNEKKFQQTQAINVQNNRGIRLF